MLNPARAFGGGGISFSHKSCWGGFTGVWLLILRGLDGWLLDGGTLYVKRTVITLGFSFWSRHRWPLGLQLALHNLATSRRTGEEPRILIGDKGTK